MTRIPNTSWIRDYSQANPTDEFAKKVCRNLCSCGTRSNGFVSIDEYGGLHGVKTCKERVLCPYCRKVYEGRKLAERQWEYEWMRQHGHITTAHVVLTQRHTAKDDPFELSNVVMQQYYAISKWASKHRKIITAWDGEFEVTYDKDYGIHAHIHLYIWFDDSVMDVNSLEKKLWDLRESAIQKIDPRKDKQKWIVPTKGWFTVYKENTKMEYYLSKTRRTMEEEISCTYSLKHPSDLYPAHIRLTIAKLMHYKGRLKGGLINTAIKERKAENLTYEEPELKIHIEGTAWNVLSAIDIHQIRTAAQRQQWREVYDLLKHALIYGDASKKYLENYGHLPFFEDLVIRAG